MTPDKTVKKSRKRSIHRWIRVGFLLWAIISLSWLANSVRTRGVDDNLLLSTQGVTVVDSPTALEFLPAKPTGKSGLIFICGAGIHSHAYAPLLRPIADAGYPVSIVKLPYRFAPLSSHKEAAADRVRSLVAAHTEVLHWVIAGHSLGGAITARIAQTERGSDKAFVLIGTTHPKEHDLSKIDAQVTKVYATNDGVAPADKIMLNKALLPAGTKWVEIKGGNHSQFAHYGHQLFDGEATISREVQQAMTRETLLEALRQWGN
jgi:pimeloyl-ACP methyl ester carboxylesterase